MATEIEEVIIDLTKLDRSLPIRVSMTVACVLTFAGVILAEANFPALAGQAFDALPYVLGVIGTAIAGDTYRPSGSKT